MSKGLNTTRGLTSEWARLRAKVTGEAAPTPQTSPSEVRPPSSVPDRSTSKGLLEAWSQAKQKVLEQNDPKLAKRAEMRAKLEQLRAIDPESAAAIEREIDRLDAADKQEK